ncbi:MAG: hypothetical protein FJZ08_01415 [Candidatus Omnitrophica bacterium]|nr:hypothetical protein [Candidatus Omnitrophota bacterium]
MENFFTNQIDYVYFIYGLSFIILGAISYLLFITNKNQLFLKWLALFGFMQGAQQWLDLLGLSVADPQAFQFISLLILIASFLFFSEIGRDEAQKIFGKAYGRWILLPAILILLFGWSLNGIVGIDVFSRYIFGFIGGLWTSFAIYRKSKEDIAKSKKQDFLLLAVIIGLFALTQLIVPAAKIFPATFLNEKTFINSTGIPIQAVRAMFIILAAFTIWFIVFKENARIKYRAALVFLAVLVLGWVFTENIALRYQKNLRKTF